MSIIRVKDDQIKMKKAIKEHKLDMNHIEKPKVNINLYPKVRSLKLSIK